MGSTLLEEILSLVFGGIFDGKLVVASRPERSRVSAWPYAIIEKHYFDLTVVVP